MSPMAFKQQVTAIVSELSRCWDLCQTIRANRRLGTTTDALDQLQNALNSSINSIQFSFNSLQKLRGSRMDTGDEKALYAMNQKIRDVQVDIYPRLENIAYKRKETHSSPELPGFRDILRRWQRIEFGVTETIASLSQRLEEKSKAEVPKPSPKPAPKAKTTDEVIISMKEFAALIDLKKNSWTETSVAGKILYVNVLDNKKSQWEKPDGFIKSLPKSSKPARTQTWESEERPKRERVRFEDPWDTSRGW